MSAAIAGLYHTVLPHQSVSIIQSDADSLPLHKMKPVTTQPPFAKLSTPTSLIIDITTQHSWVTYTCQINVLTRS
jgi:hypothetical protein